MLDALLGEARRLGVEFRFGLRVEDLKALDGRFDLKMGAGRMTAGGVSLSEINPATMESRKVPGLHLVGEILDVDGRIGGFNFQWVWSTGWVAAQAV